MTLQQFVEVLLAAAVFSAMFSGPPVAVLGLWLIRRSERRPWLMILIRSQKEGGTA